MTLSPWSMIVLPSFIRLNVRLSCSRDTSYYVLCRLTWPSLLALIRDRASNLHMSYCASFLYPLNVLSYALQAHMTSLNGGVQPIIHFDVLLASAHDASFLMIFFFFHDLFLRFIHLAHLLWTPSNRVCETSDTRCIVLTFAVGLFYCCYRPLSLLQ